MQLLHQAVAFTNGWEDNVCSIKVARVARRRLFHQFKSSPSGLRDDGYDITQLNRQSVSAT
eukprot:scaffold29540_cov41-Prasinocladus_malaysianus.AAC.1